MGLKLFGTGAHTQIYAAYDKKLDNLVAIKKLDISTPAQGEQLKREIAVIKKAKHVSYATSQPSQKKNFIFKLN